MIAQHQLLGVGMEVDLLVYLTLRSAPPLNPGAWQAPSRDRVAIAVILSHKTGHKRQNLINLTTRFSTEHGEPATWPPGSYHGWTLTN
jgi:hypothetical protein